MLTRVAKQRAVAAMTSRLAQASEEYAYACADRGDGNWEHWQRRQMWLQTAVVRLAMTRTCD